MQPRSPDIGLWLLVAFSLLLLALLVNGMPVLDEAVRIRETQVPKW